MVLLLLVSVNVALTTGSDYIMVFILYWQNKYQQSNILKIKCGIN